MLLVPRAPLGYFVTLGGSEVKMHPCSGGTVLSPSGPDSEISIVGPMTWSIILPPSYPQKEHSCFQHNFVKLDKVTSEGVNLFVFFAEEGVNFFWGTR